MSRRRYNSSCNEYDAAAILVVGGVVIVGGIVIGVGIGCYYAGKGAWWLGKKGVEAVENANEKREKENSRKKLEKSRAYLENKNAKDERRKAKGKEVEAPKYKVPVEYLTLDADAFKKEVGVFTLRFGSCKDLKNLDTVGKSDPYAKLYFTDYLGDKVHYFKTATIDETLNPVWQQEEITIHYFPGMNLLIKIYDEDPGRDELEGVALIKLADLFEKAKPGDDFQSVTYDLTAYDKNKRTNSVSQLLNPSGITDKNVRGTVSFSYAYCSDEYLTQKGMDQMPVVVEDDKL